MVDAEGETEIICGLCPQVLMIWQCGDKSKILKVKNKFVLKYVLLIYVLGIQRR